MILMWSDLGYDTIMKHAELISMLITMVIVFGVMIIDDILDNRKDKNK